MRQIFVIFMILTMLFSCREENPTPTGAFEYSLPYYQNMDGGVLANLNEQIAQGVFGDIHSLLIVRNGHMVFENYYSNLQREDLHPIGASTQSIVSAVVGIQKHQDETFSLSAKIIDYFPEYAQYFDNVPQKDKIEVQHLMSHTSGLWWDESSTPFGTEDNNAYKMSLSDDWVGHVLSTPMIKEPGNNFNFNSGDAILMAPILEKATGMDLELLTEEKLFKPLEIAEWKWERIANGFVNAAWGLHLKPVDMAKIGYLYLRNGSWDDQILFDDVWQINSTRRRSIVSSSFSYGYFWWSFNHYADAVKYLRSNDVYFSWGEGGQFIFVIPHLDLVVVSTAGNYNNSETKAIDMLKEYIFPSIRDNYL